MSVGLRFALCQSGLDLWLLCGWEGGKWERQRDRLLESLLNLLAVKVCSVLLAWTYRDLQNLMLVPLKYHICGLLILEFDIRFFSSDTSNQSVFSSTTQYTYFFLIPSKLNATPRPSIFFYCQLMFNSCVQLTILMYSWPSNGSELYHLALWVQ